MTTDDDKEFHANRSTGLGGSDAAAVAGIDPWQSSYELYLRKRGELDPVIETEPMRWGKILEPIVAEEYSRRTGRRLVRLEDMLRHPLHEWMIGHVDRVIADEDGILECKTARIAIGWGEPGTDQIPLHYSAQVHHYLMLTGVMFCDIALLVGGSDFRIYTVAADQDIADALLEKERAFWERVQTGQPPDPINVQDAIRRWGKLDVAGRVQAGPTEMEAVHELRELRSRKSDIEDREETCKGVILRALGDAGDTLVDAAGYPIATWRLDRGRKGYFVEAREPQRRFLLKSE